MPQKCIAVSPLMLLFGVKVFSFFLFRYMQFYTKDKKCLIISDFLKSSDEDILFSPNHYCLGLGLSKSNSFWIKPRVCLYTSGFILFFSYPISNTISILSAPAHNIYPEFDYFFLTSTVVFPVQFTIISGMDCCNSLLPVALLPYNHETAL